MWKIYRNYGYVKSIRDFFYFLYAYIEVLIEVEQTLFAMGEFWIKKIIMQYTQSIINVFFVVYTSPEYMYEFIINT